MERLSDACYSRRLSAARTRLTVTALFLLTTACGGGGGSDGSDSDQGDGDDSSSVASVPVGAEYLVSGFPLEVSLNPGSYISPLYMKVEDIDRDPELELIFQPGNSFIYAWNSDGTTLSGWPRHASTYQHGKQVLVQFDDDEELEVFSGHEDWGTPSTQCELNAFDHDGELLPGWPQECSGSFDQAPVAWDYDGDGYDEVFYFDGRLSRVDRHGAISEIDIEGLPPTFTHDWGLMAVADIDSDTNEGLILMGGSYYELPENTEYMNLYVLDRNQKVVEGFPVQFRAGVMFQPLVGDVDGDGEREIVAFAPATREQYETYGARSLIAVVSKEGVIENEILLDHQIYKQPILADIDQSGAAEILVQLDQNIHVLDSWGNLLPGWPVPSGDYFAVGDIDGDLFPEIVTFVDYDSAYSSRNKKSLAVYSPDGSLRDIAVVIDYMGRQAARVMPVIADVDLDGRNELIAIGSYWEGEAGYFPQVWMFDFGGGMHGSVLWGQMYGDGSNSGSYPSD